MKALLPAIVLAFVLLVAGCASPQAGGAKVCAICSGKLVRIGTIKDDRDKPSRNIDAWNRSMCALDPPPDDAFCTRCWHTYSQNSERWTRSSEVLTRSISRSAQRFGMCRCQLRIRSSFINGSSKAN